MDLSDRPAVTGVRMPAAFIGHGSPMNTLEVNRFTQAWRDFGTTLPRPRAVLAISAHWFIHGSAVTAMRQPRVIHDFYGFPRALFEFDYPAPGSPEIAAEVIEIVKPAYIGKDEDSWGLDHGTWSVLAHVLPNPDVPVLQLSIHAGEDIEYHVDLGARLAPLRDRGVFIMCSGNVVHNLSRIDRTSPDSAYEWGQRFDLEVRRIMTSRPTDIVSAPTHPEYRLAVPTSEHFLPLTYLCGLCGAANEVAAPFAEGGTLGSLTMTSYVLGSAAPPTRESVISNSIPGAGAAPAEQTNL
jgi:4,5-DOPA dioxygenase extradiol